MRIFFVTSTPPMPTWGGAMAFYRHFVERTDCTVAVATDHAPLRDHAVPYPVTWLQTPAWLRRLQRTRLGAWVHAWQHLALGRRAPADVLAAARIFAPDAVLTVAGSWSWTAGLAATVARALRRPLVGSFNDWFDYNLIVPPALKPCVERRFRGLYAESALALCTCEGMQEALGPHRRALIHYPMGAAITSTTTPSSAATFRVLYGGNLGESYGPMIEALVSAARARGDLQPALEFRICGANPNWSPAFADFARKSGIYLGQVPFERLQAEARAAHALLLPMGFEPAQAHIERTSFKTKFLDYLSFERPILVWGPPYSSAVRVAREFDSAEVVDSADARDCLARLAALSRDPARQSALLHRARRMYEDRFHPDTIHRRLMDALRTLSSAPS